ncbi:MAG: hypothetical protein JSW43_03480 [Gemmatimonadota bacterium]|nr:MAG: hypothetical protein JSW43_03480 [Gemmatimonadota bacterium]
MKRLVFAGLLAGTLGMLPNPKPADASRTVACMLSSIASCDRDFPTKDVYLAAARGYCYMIRTAICRVF